MITMKLPFNKYYWLFISIGIIVNIFIFIFFSKNLEKRVYEGILARQAIASIE